MIDNELTEKLEATSETKETHSYTLQPQYRDKITVPMLRISGKWLAMAGFQIKQKVSITVKEGTLIIEKEQKT